MFALTSLVGGGICNVLGPKLTVFLGTLGYASTSERCGAFKLKELDGSLSSQARFSVSLLHYHGPRRYHRQARGDLYPHEEIIGMWNLLKDWRMLALLPISFASSYFYAYQSALNVARFDGPTRALNGILTSVGSIVANFINYKDKAYRGKGALYFFYPLVDACLQALGSWTLGALTNDPFKAARYAGLYKAILGAAGAGSFGMDAVATPLLNEHLASWILMLVSFPFAWLVLRTVKETNYEDEKVVYIDDIKKDEQEKDGEEGSIEKASISANANM
ncbi:hypothetical protein A0H81_02732 [Grifola frondosa]|uniref:Uncharacterized protein n=1 Tax=Grifola frondosa TaxID=5627 RepID=A0A1C7MLR5_GRIFR|nr:hypothetical protein A0H81_02732 [Grifola frondosa]